MPLSLTILAAIPACPTPLEFKACTSVYTIKWCFMSFCQELCVLVFWVSAISPTLAWSWRYSEHWDQIFCTQPEKVSLGTIFVKFSLGIKLTELWPPASTILCTHYGERFSHTPNQPLAVGNWFIFLYQDGLHTLNSCWVCDWNVYHLCCANTGRVVLQCESSDIKRVSISRDYVLQKFPPIVCSK